MNLITKELAGKIPELYSQESEKDPLCVARIFHPFSSYSLYIIEYKADEELAFGLVIGPEVELGYVSMKELEEVELMGLGMERDLYYEEERLSVVKERYEDMRR